MGQHTTFRAIFTEFRRALAAARRYENLRYGRAYRDHFAPGEIPRQVCRTLKMMPRFFR